MKKHNCKESRCYRRPPRRRDFAYHLVIGVRKVFDDVLIRMERDNLTAGHLHKINQDRQSKMAVDWDPAVVDFTSGDKEWVLLLAQLKWGWRRIQRAYRELYEEG